MAKVTEVRLTIAAIIYAVEIDLKNLITTHLTPFHSELSFIGSHELIDKTTKRFRKDNPNVDIQSNIDEVVEFLDFGDFYHIILSNSTFFSDSIISELKKSINDLEKITSIRNRVMHTRPLMNGDFSTSFSFAKEKQKNTQQIWNTLSATLDKIEDDPSYVLTLRLPILKYSDEEAHHNLPIPDFDETGFIGRTKDVKDVLKLILGNNRVVTIMGEGGVGKTALALKVGYDILDLGTKNPFDVIIWVSAKTTMLTANGIQDIKNALLDYGGVIEDISNFVDGPKNKNEHLATILEYMELFDALLIIDNLETVLDENIREFIRDASQRGKILITSRIGLGELEFRRPLSGLSDKESISLIRGLANLKKSTVINKLKETELIEIVSKLHFNPLSLKWFVNSVETGISPNEVLNNRGELLDFCLSNVYDKLSEDAVLILQTILAARKNLNDAELVFTTELPSLILRQAMNELFSTTFISREIQYSGDEQDLRYSIPDFSKEYVLKNHPVSTDYINLISKRLKSLNTSALNITRISEYNEFGINAITIRNANEKVVARLLNEALKLSKSTKVSEALDKVNEAKSILPNYFEVYRVSAFIKATYEDILGAENDYILGLEIEPDNPRLLYFYGSFLLYNLNDLEKAFEYAEKAFTLRPKSEYPTLLFSRILSTSGDYEKSIKLLTNLKVKSGTTAKSLRIINTDLISVYSYWGRAITDKEGDYGEAIQKFNLGIKIYEDSINSRNYDARMTKTFCNLIKSFVKSIPKANIGDNLQKLEDLLYKHDDQISINQSKDYLSNLLNNVYGVIPANTSRLTGLISTINYKRLFAFIKQENGDELYANKKGFKFESDFIFLKKGMKVTYEVGENTQGPCATNISVKELAKSKQQIKLDD